MFFFVVEVERSCRLASSSRRRRLFRNRTPSRVLSPLLHVLLDTLIETRFDVLRQSEHRDRVKRTRTVPRARVSFSRSKEEKQPTFFFFFFRLFSPLARQSSLCSSLSLSTPLVRLQSFSHLLGGTAGTDGLGLLRSGSRPEGLRAHGCVEKERGFEKKEKERRKKLGAVWQQAGRVVSHFLSLARLGSSPSKNLAFFEF